MAAQAAAMSGSGKPLPNMNGLLALRGETADQKRSRELFIGNLPAPAPTEFQLKDFLSAAVQQAGMCTMPGTSLIQIRIQKNFAFAEFRSVEEANLAMNLNEIIYQNCALSVGRPSRYTGPVGEQVSYGEYIAQHKPEVLNLPDAVGLPAGSAAALGEAESKILRELYVGNLPLNVGLSEKQIAEFIVSLLRQRGMIGLEEKEPIISVWVAPVLLKVLSIVTFRQTRPSPIVKERPLTGGFVPSSRLM